MFRIAPGNSDQPPGHSLKNKLYRCILIHQLLVQRSTRHAPYSALPVLHPCGAMIEKLLNITLANFCPVKQHLDQFSHNLFSGHEAYLSAF